MQTVSWNWFWYVLVGFLLGGCSVYVWHILKMKNIKMVWYELVLSILIFLVFLFMGQTFIASFGEGEPRAAWLSLFFMGVPIIIMGVITVRSIQSRSVRT